MKQRMLAFLNERRLRIDRRLHRGKRRRFVRCPACRSLQSVPAGRGQSKVICRRCGEIFLRRT